MQSEWDTLTTWQRICLLMPMCFIIVGAGYSLEYVLHLELGVPRYFMRLLTLVNCMLAGKFFNFLGRGCFIERKVKYDKEQEPVSTDYTVLR